MKSNIDISKSKEYGSPLLDEEITELKENSETRSGCWEIDSRPEPFFHALSGGAAGFVLTIVVHQESHYIIETHVDPSEKIGKGIAAFNEAVKKQFTLPEIVQVRDENLRNELIPLSKIFGFRIEIRRLKAIPQILREMRQILA